MLNHPILRRYRRSALVLIWALVVITAFPLLPIPDWNMESGSASPWASSGGAVGAHPSRSLSWRCATPIQTIRRHDLPHELGPQLINPDKPHGKTSVSENLPASALVLPISGDILDDEVDESPLAGLLCAPLPPKSADNSLIHNAGAAEPSVTIASVRAAADVEFAETPLDLLVLQTAFLEASQYGSHDTRGSPLHSQPNALPRLRVA